MIKLVAIDFDGTLYDDEQNVSEENKAAVLQAHDRGIRIVPCSGRYEGCMLDGVRALDLYREGEFYICSNGVAIHEGGSGRVLHEDLFPKKVLPWLLEYGRTHDDEVNIQLYFHNHHYIERMMPVSLKYDLEAGAPAVVVERLESLFDEPIEKVAFTYMGSPQQMAEFQDNMLPLLPKGIQMFRAADYLLEFVSSDAGKWHAVHTLAEKLGIADSEILCIGDSENDLQMVMSAGFGAVPANADPVVKEAADYISSHNNNHSAVADIIKHYQLL